MGIVTVSFTLALLFNIHIFAWHENLGIDANKAAELYQTKPNDPAIVQWKNALQLAINGMGECLDVEKAISCEKSMSIIISNCNSHPNELLACNDNRLPLYPLILKKAQQALANIQAEANNASSAYDRCSEQIDKHKFGWGWEQHQKCGPIIFAHCNDPAYARYITQCKEY